MNDKYKKVEKSFSWLKNFHKAGAIIVNSHPGIVVETILLRVTLKTVLPEKWWKKGNENEKEKSNAAVNRLNELLDFCQLYWLFEMQLKLSYPDNSIHAALALIYVINRENITPAHSLNIMKTSQWFTAQWWFVNQMKPSSFVIVIAWKLITLRRLTRTFGNLWIQILGWVLNHFILYVHTYEYTIFHGHNLKDDYQL